jgi:hypothetical protein
MESTMKLTVSEYSTQFKTSVQSVYQRIKRGTLKSVEENGIKYVIIDDNTASNGVKSTLKPEVKSEFKYLVKLIKRLQNQIDKKDKEILRLTKKLEKCSNSKSDVLLQYISELKQLQLTHNTGTVVDVPELKKKKRKKSKKDERSKRKKN